MCIRDRALTLQSATLMKIHVNIFLSNRTVDVHNVSLIPSDNPLTLAEGVQKMVRCVVNINAVPAPTITWYLGSTDIKNMAGTDVSVIIITGNRNHNNKTLECKATNNNKPSKTDATTLNVECKFLLSKSE